MPTRLTEPAIGKALREAQQSRTRRDLADAGQSGLRLRVTPSGGNSWVLACRDRQGRMRRFTLGHYPAMGISAAREAARALHHKVRQEGADPTAERRAERAKAKDAAEEIGTLGALVAHYGTQRGSTMKSWPDCRRRIEHVFAAHLKRPLRSLTAMDLQAAADTHGSQQAAAAAVRYLRPLLRWAGKRGWVPRELVLIEPPTRVASRERVLTDSELAAVWRAAEAREGVFGRIVRLLILTGQRRDEVADMRWSELSPDRTIWTIASGRMKGGRAHIVPLSEMARALLPEAPDEAGTGLVFPGQRLTPFSGWSKCKAQLDRNSGVAGWRLHDLRRTFATGLQRLGVRLEVTEAAIGHVSGSRAGVVGIYQRHEWQTEKRAALDAWAEHVRAILAGEQTGGNVVQLRTPQPVAA